MKLNKYFSQAFYILLKTKIKYLIKVKLFKQYEHKKIAADYLDNPMLKYPRNQSCWCKSGLKAKRCCLPKQSRILPQEVAKQAKVLLRVTAGD